MLPVDTAPDRLAQLLDVVVGSVGESIGPEEVARRAYLSRFHFDRLVSAALHESPAAFRRRLLLERAAYRMARDPGVAVIEVAYDAGYGSPEAFTRAFARAYGAPPSAHRRTPGPFRLPAANGIHFHPPGGLSLPGDRGGPPMSIAERLLAHDEWLVGQLLERAAELPPEELDRPLESSYEPLDEEPTIRSLLGHLVYSKERWIAAVEGREPPAGHETSLDELRERWAQIAPAFRRIVVEADARGALDDAFVDATCDPPRTFTYAGMAMHVATFSAHRRTVVIGALWRLGIRDLGSGDPASFEPTAPGPRRRRAPRRRVPGVAEQTFAPRFAGRRAIISGGGRGIGEAIARRFAAEGAEVMVVARTGDEVEAVAASIAEAGGRAFAHAADVGDEAQVDAALDGGAGPLGARRRARQLRGHRPRLRLPRLPGG